MAVSLSKGGNVSLSKEAPGLTAVVVGLGWDARVTDGKDFDLDASVFITGEDGKVRSDADFVFYNNKTGADGAVEHQGDNRTGEGDGDDEQVKIDLSKVPADVKKLVFAVTIHEADDRGQNFGQVSNAFMRVINQDGDAELARYDLSEDYSTETALVFGELYRHGDEWKFKAVGAGFAGGLNALAASHGVNMG
jgi:tellurium resistance protein TerD